MKILVLCKRRPQNKDLIERPYGRFYYLPKILAEKSHDVHHLVLSYKNEPKIVTETGGIKWTSISLIRHGPQAYIREARKIIQEMDADWLIGFSDTYYGILAQRLAAEYNTSSIIDAYDNFESYIPWLKPLHYAWRHSLAKATLVTAAGPSLAKLLGKSRPNKPTEIIPMAADQKFHPLNKVECREKLGLPLDKKLIGYSGSTMKSSLGVQVLFEAYSSLKKERSDIALVLSGNKGRNITLPPDAKWLGYLHDEYMPFLVNSLDVLVVMSQPTAFGNYGYPVKLYEAMSCNIPAVVSRTLSTQWIMHNNMDLLVPPDDKEQLVEKLKYALEPKKINYGYHSSWIEIGKHFEKLLHVYRI